MKAIRNPEQPPAAGSASVSTEQLVIRLSPAGVIAGRVTDSDGQPISLAVVQLSRLFRDGTTTMLSPITQTTTNDLGDYRLFNIEPGRYYVAASYQDQGSRLGLRQRIITENEKPETEDFAVTFYPQSLTPENALPVRARAGNPVNGIDIRLQMSRSVTVSGAIQGIPKDSVPPRVYLQAPQPTSLGAFRTFTLSPGSAGFEFKSVAAGRYILRAELNAGGHNLSGREELQVGSSAVNNVVLTLQPPFTVSGLVKTEEGNDPPPELQLQLNGIDRRFVGPIKLRSVGTFEAQVPGAHTYTLDAKSTSGNAYVKSVTLDDRIDGAKGVFINGPNHLLHIIVSDKAARVSGKVIDPEHNLPQGLIVLVGPDIAGRPRSYTVAVSHDGQFALSSLPPGQYRVSCFSDLTSPGEATWDIQNLVARSGTDVRLADGDQVQLNVNAIIADPL